MSEFETLKFHLPSGRSCEIQELPAEAERVLTDKALVKSGRWLNKFISYALVSLDDKPVSSNEGERIALLLDMLSGDRNYLILRIRMQNYGDTMMFNYQCPKCGKTFGYSVNLKDMLDDGTLKIYPYDENVPLKVETRAGIAEIDYMTGREEQWLADQKDLNLIHIAMAACKKFNGEIPDIKTFGKLYVKDLSKIREASNNLKGGLDPSIELDCPDCDNSYSIMMYQIPDFFIPSMMKGSSGN